MISIDCLNYSVEKSILQDISLNISKGEIHGIVGLSGAGKSSLLKLIGGFLNATAGTIRFEGKRIIGPAEKMIPGYEDLQLVNQDYQLDLYHTVRENIRVQAQHLTLDDREEMIKELLELLDLSSIQNLKAHLISGGEQQRLALARSLAKEPKVLLLDEPFAHLDVHLKARVIEYLLALRKVRQLTIIIVTHNGQEAMAMCDQIHFLDKGKISRTASPIEFYEKPSSFFEASFFGEINQVQIGSETILFRPNQYQFASNNQLKLDLTFSHAVFQGFYTASYFKSNKDKNIVLYADKPLTEIKSIYLK